MDNQEQSMSNPDMEMMLLSCIIKQPDWYYANSEVLSHEIFTSRAHSFIYRAIIHCAESTSIDISQIEDYCNRKFSEIYYNETNHDLVDYLYQTANRLDVTDRFHEYLKILNEYKVKRQLFNFAESIKDSCLIDDSVDTILSTANRDLANIENVGDIHDFDLDDIITQTYESMISTKKREYVKSYFQALDNFIIGWEQPELVIVAGRPGMGKTAFALEVFKQNFKRDIFGAFFSLEMNTNQLITRLMASEATVSLKDIRKGFLDQGSQIALGSAAKSFKESKFYIDDKSTSLTKIVTKCKKLKKQNDLKFVIIDYLQLMSSKGDNREQQISTISRTLKQMARELEIVVIALSQLSRAVETRGGDKKPFLSDLRESGAIEQDADSVIFPYRPAYYFPEEAQDIQKVELIIAKGRSTGTGDVETHFIPEYQQFILDPKSDPRMGTIISQDIRNVVDFTEPQKEQEDGPLF